VSVKPTPTSFTCGFPARFALRCCLPVALGLSKQSARYGNKHPMNFSMPLKNEPHIEKPHCCPSMTDQANMYDPHAPSKLLGSTDKRIYWSSIFGEYGLICHPSSEILVISNCPFCGVDLPGSKRSTWFSALEASGWESWEDPIPDFMYELSWEEKCRSQK